ncbi:MAG: hypothetical protein AAF252_14845, partial [Pseudomonadota bacterium]
MTRQTRAAKVRQRADPAPSRWSWRMQRLMLTPLFRLALRAGLPFVITLGTATWFLTDPDNQAAIQETVAEARAAIEQRPEFMVNLMAIDGGDSAKIIPSSTACTRVCLQVCSSSCRYRYSRFCLLHSSTRRSSCSSWLVAS